jgi:predicted subunit of tRNA(5-methylaminomethyl-2-thiouridylate) methyltransferase
MNHTYIDRIVTKHFGIKDNLHSFNKKDAAIKARHAAMLLCSEVLNYSLHRIRKAYQRKSHSGIHSNLNAARNLYDTDSDFRSKYTAAKEEAVKLKQDWVLIKQRYNLHYRLRCKGVQINTKERMVSIEFNQEHMIADAHQLRNLLEQHNYSIQYAIFT